MAYVGKLMGGDIASKQQSTVGDHGRVIDCSQAFTADGAVMLLCWMQSIGRIGITGSQSGTVLAGRLLGCPPTRNQREEQ
jgi:hypothetical protein